MPTTFDISETPKFNSQNGPQKAGRGTGLPIDNFARGLLYIALIASALLLGYLLWGLYSGAWANPSFKKLEPAIRTLQLNNIQLVFTGLRISLLLSVISVLICCARDEGIGYVLVGISAFFYLGLPFLTAQIFDWQSLTDSRASKTVVVDLQSLWWMFGIPGALWMCVDFVRRFQSMSENAAIQRANVKYGSGMNKQGTQRQKFLGRCWELPYCRDNIRPRCPIFLKRRGPCWRYKEGCMCEEHIVLQAVIATDWKMQTAAATKTPLSNLGQPIAPTGPVAPRAPISGGQPPAPGQPPRPTQGPNRLSLNATPKSNLSAADKAERCRNCIIFNEHQRQKYKALVGVVFAVLPVIVYFNLTLLEKISTGLIAFLETVTTRFSLGQSSQPMLASDSAHTLSYVILGAGAIVVLAWTLRVVEYLCFTKKI